MWVTTSPLCTVAGPEGSTSVIQLHPSCILASATHGPGDAGEPGSLWCAETTAASLPAQQDRIIASRSTTRTHSGYKTGFHRESFLSAPNVLSASNVLTLCRTIHDVHRKQFDSADLLTSELLQATAHFHVKQYAACVPLYEAAMQFCGGGGRAGKAARLLALCAMTQQQPNKCAPHLRRKLSDGSHAIKYVKYVKSLIFRCGPRPVALPPSVFSVATATASGSPLVLTD